MERWKEQYEELRKVLGYDTFGLTGISENYRARGLFPVNQTDISRLNFLSKIVDHLKGAYNNEGIQKWFCRKRKELGNRPPRKILYEDCWYPHEKDVQKVLELAKSVNSDAT